MRRSQRDTLPVVARLDRLREFVDRLHPSGLLYATYEHRLIAELDTERLPRHVAVLADGNRRWARTNAPEQPLVAGYQAGADKLKEFVGVVRRARDPGCHLVGAVDGQLVAQQS